MARQQILAQSCRTQLQADCVASDQMPAKAFCGDAHQLCFANARIGCTSHDSVLAEAC